MAAARISDYLARVIASFTRIWLLVAMLFMPFGMGQPAVANAHPTSALDMAAGHCPDSAQHQSNKAMPGDCTMACASALPALDEPTLPLVPIAAMPVQPRLSPRLFGLLLDIATPPPRAA